MSVLGLAALGALNAVNGYGVNPYMGGFGGGLLPGQFGGGLFAGNVGGFGGLGAGNMAANPFMANNAFVRDPREPYSPFTVTATLRDNQDFFMWGAPNEFQASVFRDNPELYGHVYDQYPHPGYLYTRPSWAGGVPGGGRLNLLG